MCSAFCSIRSAQTDMLHTKRETILKGRLGTNILEVGAYYAMLSDMNAHCLIHVLEQDKGDYIVDSLYVSKPKRMFRFWHNFTKVRKTTAEVFQQAVDCYDNSVKATFPSTSKRLPSKAIVTPTDTTIASKKSQTIESLAD